ncbi:Riboflavin kinase [Fragilaria crotonensis]|nr:Riboflavin kinase [Fragilaria crotonensis]
MDPPGDQESTDPISVDDVGKHLPIRMISKVVRGFGRGSTDLGIPTANLCRESGDFSTSFDAMPCGIYWGFARVGDKSEEDRKVYKAAISIGYNPYFGNETKTVEPHLIAPPSDERRHKSSCQETVLREFYDEPIRLSVVGYLRPELPFEGLEKLIEAIKKDIQDSELLGDGTDDLTVQEHDWVEGSDAVTKDS